MIIKLRWVINSDTGEKILQAYDGDSWKIVPTVYGESVTIEQVKKEEERYESNEMY